MRTFLLTGVAFTALATGAANAALITTASLFSPLPPVGATTTTIALQNVPGVAAGGASQAPVVGNGFSIAFSVAGNQGVVQGSVPSSTHAVPVAGVSNGAPTYLTGDFGSAQTTNASASGKYLSTGTGSITISFTTPQTSLALLWGSIDASNQITFNNATNDVLTGATVQTLAAGFAGNGFQGPAGSAYVRTTSNTSFSSVTLTSGVISFEAAGIAGSSAPFTSVPEPASLALLGAGLVGAGLLRRRRAI